MNTNPEVPVNDSVGGLEDGRKYWKVEVTVWANEEQVSELGHNIELMLCPEPDHQPPCPIPWELGWHTIDDTDPDVESLSNQVSAEYPKQAVPTSSEGP